MSRPLSSVLKSSDLVKNAFERYRMPVKIMAKEKIKPQEVRDSKTPQIKENPFTDFSKPYFYHHKKPAKKKHEKKQLEIKIDQ